MRDSNCGKKLPYICQLRPVATTTSAAVTTATTAIPTGTQAMTMTTTTTMTTTSNAVIWATVAKIPGSYYQEALAQGESSTTDELTENYQQQVISNEL